MAPWSSRSRSSRCARRSTPFSAAPAARSSSSSAAPDVTTVVFYEKPGCGTNARQKLMLTRAGHDVVARNLLTESWTGERLRAYFAGTPVWAWFNPASPRVKSGEIEPETIEAVAAIDLMLEDPLLIRRPLIEAGGQCCAGFDREPVISLLRQCDDLDDVQGCTRPEASTPCPEPR
ncbi:ArsC/Spx/MgsR family protein [Bradyrhizobium oligotrophicum]|uniref:ArsC/Spx/MgsR family protein n=1 Tax=Bradyrhizobium oligotrophicum TaxID=44255 RepID=UPI003EBBC22E